MTYLVAGATGTVGRHVVSALREAGREVRALTRNPAAAGLPEGVEAVRGELSRVESFAAALDGVVGVHLVNFGGEADHAPLENGPQIVDALRAAGVRRVSMLAGWAESTLEPAVKSSDLGWTHVMPTEFMANALQWAESVRAGRVEEPFVDTETAMVHEADIGAVAAHALMDDGHAGQSYRLTGPQRLSLRDKIRTVGAAVGKQIELVELTPEQAREKLTREGTPAEMIDFLLGVFGDPPAEANTVNENVERVTGRPARSFAQWAAENAAAFGG